MKNMNTSLKFSATASPLKKKSILSHTSWIQTRACFQQCMLALIMIKRGGLPPSLANSPVTPLCTPKLTASLLPIIFNGSWSKACVGCAITAWLGCTIFPLMSYGRWTRKAFQGHRGVRASLRRTEYRLTRLNSVLFASLSWGIFYEDFVCRIFISDAMLNQRTFCPSPCINCPKKSPAPLSPLAHRHTSLQIWVLLMHSV